MKSFIAMIGVFVFVGTLNAAELSKPTHSLNHTNITYRYTNDLSFNVKFADEGASYRFLTGPDPEKWWGPFPYQAFEVEKNLYFTSWLEKKTGDYVTLLINFNNNLLYGSAIISGKKVLFKGAKMVSVSRQ